MYPWVCLTGLRPSVCVVGSVAPSVFPVGVSFSRCLEVCARRQAVVMGLFA